MVGIIAGERKNLCANANANAFQLKIIVSMDFNGLNKSDNGYEFGQWEKY